MVKFLLLSAEIVLCRLIRGKKLFYVEYKMNKLLVLISIMSYFSREKNGESDSWDLSRFKEEQQELNCRIASLTIQKEVANDYRMLAEKENVNIKKELQKQVEICKIAMQQIEIMGQQNHELEQMVIAHRRDEKTVRNEIVKLKQEIAELKREQSARNVLNDHSYI